MKRISLFSMVIAGLLANNAAAMDIIPSLTRLGTDAVAKNISPTQFINDSFARKHAPLYRQLGLGLIDREDVQDKDKLAVARSVIAQVLEGNLTDTYYSKTDIKPFLNVITHDFAKKHLAPNPFLACHKVRPISDSVTKMLASLHLSDKSKKYLEKDATLNMLSSLVSRYADHPRKLEHVKRSLLKAIETADVPQKLKKIFRKEIETMDSVEDQVIKELPTLIRFYRTGIWVAHVIHFAHDAPYYLQKMASYILGQSCFKPLHLNIYYYLLVLCPIFAYEVLQHPRTRHPYKEAIKAIAAFSLGVIITDKFYEMGIPTLNYLFH